MTQPLGARQPAGFSNLTPTEASAHLARLPRGVLERDIAAKAFDGSVGESDLARPIVVYCAGGARSVLAAASLRAMGFTNVQSLEGGFGAWGKCGARDRAPAVALRRSCAHGHCRVRAHGPFDFMSRAPQNGASCAGAIVGNGGGAYCGAYGASASDP